MLVWNVASTSQKYLMWADEPITEGITFRIDAESDNADKSELRRLLKMAEERCPAMYSMTHAIKVDATVN